MSNIQNSSDDRFARLEQECRDANARHADATRRFRVYLGLTMAIVCLALLLSSGRRTAIAQSNGNGLEQRVTALESKVAALQVALTAETSRAEAAETTLQNEINNIQLTPGPQGPAGPAGPQGPAGDSVFSVNGTDVTLSGYNLHIVSGSHDNTLNGLGNLTIGYNQLRNDGTDDRTGSHNLVVGDQNNYSSYGAIISGSYNEVSAPYAGVIGGNGNGADGFSSFIGGGLLESVAGPYAAVIGGSRNTANGEGSSITGGTHNSTIGSYSSISGGDNYTAFTDSMWIGGSYHSP